MVPLSGLRTVVGVTEVDQGPTVATDRRIPKKADQGKKDDRRQKQLLI